jgi:putative ABC transport system permease protein
LQIALTLAIVTNSVFIIQNYLQQMHTPSGMDESNIFTMSNEWVADVGDLEARLKEDVAALRSLPGVIDAEATGGFPLCGCGGMYSLLIKNEHGDKYHPTVIRTHLVDDHGLATYGLKLVAGRWFTPTEVGVARRVDPDVPVSAVITRHLADELFPSGSALGQLVSVVREKPGRIVGILEFATSTYIDGDHMADAAFVPLQYLNNPINCIGQARRCVRADGQTARKERIAAA